MADLKEIEAKASRGEALTAEETREVMSSPPEGIEPALDPDDKVDWGEAEDLDHPKPKDKDKAPATPVPPKEEKAPVAEAPADNKPPAEDLGKPEINMEKLEAELGKEEGKEDLKDFSTREKAYFHSMRRDRKARQQAEADRDIALRKLALAPKAPEQPAVDPNDPVELLKKRDKSDFVSVEDVLKIVEAVKAPAKKDVAPQGITPQGMNFLRLSDIEARSKHKDDYDEVMILTSDILESNSSYLQEIERRTGSGENPAEVAYELIKKDPEFPKLFPVAKTKIASMRKSKPDAAAPAKSAEEIEKERKAEEAQKALENNKTKTKTSGHASGEGVTRDDTGKYSDGKVSYTAAELTAMSDLEYARVPKKIRKAFMDDISK